MGQPFCQAPREICPAISTHPHWGGDCTITMRRQDAGADIVSGAKCVEVIIDNELNFHEQIKVMKGKLVRSVEILNKLKQTLPQTVMLQLNYALVQGSATF